MDGVCDAVKADGIVVYSIFLPIIGHQRQLRAVGRTAPNDASKY